MFKYFHIVQFCNIESYILENGNIISGRSNKNSFDEPKLYRGNLIKIYIKVWSRHGTVCLTQLLKPQVIPSSLCLKLMSKENNELGSARLPSDI